MNQVIKLRHSDIFSVLIITLGHSVIEFISLRNSVEFSYSEKNSVEIGTLYDKKGNGHETDLAACQCCPKVSKC